MKVIIVTNKSTEAIYRDCKVFDYDTEGEKVKIVFNDGVYESETESIEINATDFPVVYVIKCDDVKSVCVVDYLSTYDQLIKYRPSVEGIFNEVTNKCVIEDKTACNCIRVVGGSFGGSTDQLHVLLNDDLYKYDGFSISFNENVRQ